MKNNLPNNPDTIEQITSQRIADKMKSARNQFNYSLTELSKKSGVSAGTIHKIESCAMMPSMVTLLKIAMGLGKALTFFVEDEVPGNKFVVNRQKDAKPYSLEKSIVRAVSGNLEDAMIEIHFVTLPEGGNCGEKRLIHNCEEVTICLKGRVEFTIDEKKITLHPLDSIHIAPNVYHRWNNGWKKKSEMLNIYSPFLFSQKFAYEDSKL